MAERRRGDVSRILLNEVDVIILKILDKNKDKITILGLREILKINALSERTHVDRLVEFKFITKERVKGENKYLLNITPLGEDVLNIFEKLVGKKNYFFSN